MSQQSFLCNSTAQPSPAWHTAQPGTAVLCPAQHDSAQHSARHQHAEQTVLQHWTVCSAHPYLPTCYSRTGVHLQCPGQLQLLHHLDQGAGVVPHPCLVARTQLELTHKAGQLRPVADQQGCQCQAVTQIAVKVGHPLCCCWQRLHHSKLVVSVSNRGRTAKPSTIERSRLTDTISTRDSVQR